MMITPKNVILAVGLSALAATAHQLGCSAMAKGFTLKMAKAVMNGRTDEVIELARTNLWR